MLTDFLLSKKFVELGLLKSKSPDLTNFFEDFLVIFGQFLTKWQFTHNKKKIANVNINVKLLSFYQHVW